MLKAMGMGGPSMAKEDVTWLNGAGVLGDNCRFTVHGLPTERKHIRESSFTKFEGHKNALLEGGGEKYEINYKPIAQIEDTTNVALRNFYMQLIKPGQGTILEVCLVGSAGDLGDAKMFCYASDDRQKQLCALDWDPGFFSNTYKMLHSHSDNKKPYVLVESGKFHGNTDKMLGVPGTEIAQHFADDEQVFIDVKKGVDSYKVFAMFMFEWWTYVQQQLDTEAGN